MASTSSSSSGIQVGGLVSGIDTNSLIDGLLTIEQSRVTRQETLRDNVAEQRTAFNELATRIYGFSDKATQLATSTAFDLYKSTSNEEDIATVTGKEGASNGAFDLIAQSLATTQKTSSRNFATINTSMNLTGTFELSRSRESVLANPVKTTTTIEIKATDALKDIVTKINAAEGTGVKASILSLSNGQNRLVLTGVDQGTDGFYLKELSGDALSNPAGLGILSNTQSIRTESNLLKLTGGAAEGTTLFKDLFTSIGGNKLIAGDKITLTGASADGNIASTDFVIDPATSTVNDLLSAVRSAYGANTNVSLNSSGEIVLNNTGAGTGTMSLNMSYTGQDSSSAMTLGGSKAKNVFSNSISEGSRSFFMLDGMAISSQSNTDSKTVVGASFTLKQADPTKTVKLNLNLDKDGIKAKIQTFVDEYNSVMKFIDEKTKVIVSDSKSTASASEKQKIDSKGPLANDASVRRLKAQLMQITTSQVTLIEGRTQFSSLSRIGVSTDRTTGLLVVDDTKISKAIESDLDGVKSLFVASGFSSNPQHTLGRYDEKSTKAGVYQVNADLDQIDGNGSSSGSTLNAATRTGDVLISKSGDSKNLALKAPVGSGTGSFTFVRGLASQIKMFVDSAKDPISGFFIKTDQTYQNRIDSYDERIGKLQDQVESYHSRLTRQFASLEQSMQRLQSQSSAFQSQIGSL